ncbi:hypothetical protein [Geobacter pickeringii]|uniref:Peptidase M30, hyicolysin n=1 Tax=Geobacter pickeringii TaxID=345632 RepID=A0A0B5B6T2_9BACT|nr:hypothetical protein [Geobacter pickeringii]AJE02257.1 hypothetical protein GPICK_01690 [Geobacter pickeringii]
MSFPGLRLRRRGGGGTTAAPAGAPQTVQASASVTFWAYDLTTKQPYQLTAKKVGEGSHCYVYLEDGSSVTLSAVPAIVSQYDSVIYPAMTAAFGAEPNPGVDNDPKVYILLLKIRDGFTSNSSSYVAGFFDPSNEYLVSQYSYSNQREMIYMNVNPQAGIDPQSTDFYGTIAHEFQHMIHWQQKTNLRNVHDDTWLDEGMATVAPTVCGYGPDYGRVATYESAPSHSLTAWDDTIESYGVVYMWSQYLKDQLGAGIFRQMLQNSQTGIASVNAALAASGSSLDFATIFRNWTIANTSGNAVTWAGHPEWSYTSIDTHKGTFNGVYLPGLLDRATLNATTLSALGPWSVGYYAYTTTQPTGTVTWTPKGTGEKASFINSGANGGAGALTYDLAANAATSFTTNGYLIDQNPVGSATTTGDTVVHTSLAAAASVEPAAPAQILAAANAHPLVRSMSAQSGKPQHVCVDSYFREREKALRSQGIRPAFR